MVHHGTYALDRTGIYGSITPTSLMLPSNITYEEWELTLHNLVTLEGGIKWYIGDCLNQGEHWWGEMYTQVLEALGHRYTYQHLANMKSVAKAFPPEWRSEVLRWELYEAVAPLKRENPEASKPPRPRKPRKTEVAWDVGARQEFEKGLGRDVGHEIWSQEIISTNGHSLEPIPQLLPDAGNVEADPEWVGELLEIVLAVADADPRAWTMIEVHRKAVAWVIDHGLGFRWKG